MLRIHSYFAALLLSVLIPVSCHRSEPSGFLPVQLAEAAVADTSSAGFKCMSAYDDSGNDGTIAVFGGFDETAVMTEILLTADSFDNIDGTFSGDSLPDFAGETIMPVFDVVNAPYSGYFGTMNEDFIRETALSGFLASVSGSCSSTAFDRSLSRTKPKAKMVILSSSLMAGYGAADIDYVVSAYDKNIGVLNTVSSALSCLVSNACGPANFGVWAAGDVVSSGVYGNCFNEMKSGYQDRKSADSPEWLKTSEVVCLSPEMSDSAAVNVLAFLDRYIDAGYSAPLAGVIMDDPLATCQVDSMNAAVAEIMSSDAPLYEEYRQILSPGFEFISPMETVVSDAYRWLRKNGRFTHLVAWPDIDGYITVPSLEVGGRFIDSDGYLLDDFKYNRAPGSGAATYRFIPLSHSALCPDLAKRMEQLAPVTYKKLVYVY